MSVYCTLLSHFTGISSNLSRLAVELKAAKDRIARLEPPESCSTSNKNDVQSLRSGESVYCHDKWRVSLEVYPKCGGSV